jgi:hypothetical protein
MTRGLRNNNPLNIRRNPANRWKGLRPEQTDKELTSGRLCSRSAESKQASFSSHYDAEFCQFESMKWGIRAALILMKNYRKYGLRTPRQIIRRWAPPKENNTEGYIRSVEMLLKRIQSQPSLPEGERNGRRCLGIDSVLRTPQDYALLAQAMAWVETGQLLPDSLFETN